LFGLDFHGLLVPPFFASRRYLHSNRRTVHYITAKKFHERIRNKIETPATDEQSRIEKSPF
jgi:hypothetical protein